MRWVLTPFIAIFAVAMPLLIDEWTPARVALIGVMEFMCVAALAGFWLPPRFGQWAFRGFAGAVFVCYAAYFVHEWLFTNEPFRISERKSAASPRNALLGLIIIGLPSLWYAVMGRLTLRVDNEMDAKAGGSGYGLELRIIVKLSDREFGRESERGRILDLKHQLEIKLAEAGLGEIDGEEFGDGECCLFVQTNSPVEAEGVVREFFTAEAPLLSYTVERVEA